MTNRPSPLDRAPPEAPLLQVENLSKTFEGTRWMLGTRRAAARAVDGVSFTLRAGETLGLVGETGSGKSTLGRLVLRLIEPTGGNVAFAGADVTHLGRTALRRLRSKFQMVFQDPYGSLDPRMTVGALIAEPMLVHNHPRDTIAARVSEIMRLVGLDPLIRHRYPHQFSGGQRQRIGIARAIALSPELLVLDEPVSALDVSIQAQILNLLRDIQRRSNLAFLFIAHDLAVVRHVSDRIAVMYLGRIMEIGSRDKVYAAPRHPYTIALLSAVPIPDPVRERARQRIPLIGEIGSATAIPGGCRFHPRCYRARAVGAAGIVETAELRGERLPCLCLTREPELTSCGAEHEAACHFGPEYDPAASTRDTETETGTHGRLAG